MTKNATLTPMNRLFNRLRAKIQEHKSEIAKLKVEVQKLEQAEAELVAKHSDPALEFALNFYDEECIRSDREERIAEVVTNEQPPPPRLKLVEAVRQIFVSPETRLTTRETQSILEDMREHGQLDTKSQGITYDRTIKILRGLVKQHVLLKDVTTEGNRHITFYSRRKEG